MTEANLTIEMNVTCPHCGSYFDLFEIGNGSLNDDGYLIKKACPQNGYWGDEHKQFKKKVKCPECTKEVHIDGIAW